MVGRDGARGPSAEVKRADDTVEGPAHNMTAAHACTTHRPMRPAPSLPLVTMFRPARPT